MKIEPVDKEQKKSYPIGNAANGSNDSKPTDAPVLRLSGLVRAPDRSSENAEIGPIGLSSVSFAECIELLKSNPALGNILQKGNGDENGGCKDEA